MELITNNAYHYSVQFRQSDGVTPFTAASHRTINYGAPYQRFNPFNTAGDDPVYFTYLLDSPDVYPGTGWSSECRVVISRYSEFGTATVSVAINDSGGTPYDSAGPLATTTLVGRHSDSWIGEFSCDIAGNANTASGDYAEVQIDTPGTSSSIHQVYLGVPISFAHLARVPIKRSTFFDWVQTDADQYQCDEQIEIEVVGLTKAEAKRILGLPKLNAHPFFLYDSSGDYIAEKLIHVVMPEVPNVIEFDDRVTLGLRCYRLHDRRWL